MAQETGGKGDETDADLETVNNLLAEWAARSATTSDALIDRFEEMGYAVRDKTEDEIADVLRHPPTRPR